VEFKHTCCLNVIGWLKKGAHIHVERNTWNLFVVHNMFQKFGAKVNARLVC
jgi:hypothetical protein